LQGNARVIRCLSTQRDKLTPTCRATLFDEEVRFSENIDFQYPMKTKCLRELDMFCKEVPHGNARAIRCLQEHKDEKDFGEGRAAGGCVVHGCMGGAGWAPLRHRGLHRPEVEVAWHAA
jgi:hypothetical protein